jgi:hypothetical protein
MNDQVMLLSGIVIYLLILSIVLYRLFFKRKHGKVPFILENVGLLLIAILHPNVLDLPAVWTYVMMGLPAVILLYICRLLAGMKRKTELPR